MNTNLSKPLVSIVCLTYNHVQYIRNCIDGFLDQRTNFLFEIIIHDDASTDGTSDIIKEYFIKYPKLIKPILQKQNQYSIYGNFGIILDNCFNKCSGKYIALCEGDDYWIDPLKLQKQFDLLQSNNSIALSFHNAKVINISNGKEHIFVNNLQQGNIPYWKLILLPWCTPTASFFFRSSCLLGMKQPKDINSDMFILYSCGVKGSIYYINEISSIYRSGTPGSATDRVYQSSFIPVYKKKIALMRYINRITDNRYIHLTTIKILWLKFRIIRCKILGK